MARPRSSISKINYSTTLLPEMMNMIEKMQNRFQLNGNEIIAMAIYILVSLKSPDIIAEVENELNDDRLKNHTLNVERYNKFLNS